MTNTILSTISALPAVERVAEWKDRHYITLAAAKFSRANADLRTKIWLRGDVLTVETGKGYHSDAFSAAKDALLTAARDAGATVREG